MSFSKRMGLQIGRETIQLNSMDESLRIALYNYLHELFHDGWYDRHGDEGGVAHLAAHSVWTNFWRRAADEFPDSPYNFVTALKGNLLKGYWYRAYDLLEFLMTETALPIDFGALNRILERDMSGYRIRDNLVIPVSDSSELTALDDALALRDRFKSAREHLHNALQQLAQKPDPDCRNAITEAVSAVESAARVVSGNLKATLADALKALDKNGKVHPALKDAWLKLYGYTSDEQGLRHAMTEESAVDFPTAKYMVVSCAAFVNLLSTLPPKK